MYIRTHNILTAMLLLVNKLKKICVTPMLLIYLSNLTVTYYDKKY